MVSRDDWYALIGRLDTLGDEIDRALERSASTMNPAMAAGS